MTYAVYIVERLYDFSREYYLTYSRAINPKQTLFRLRVNNT